VVSGGFRKGIPLKTDKILGLGGEKLTWGSSLGKKKMKVAMEFDLGKGENYLLPPNSTRGCLNDLPAGHTIQWGKIQHSQGLGEGFTTEF